MKKILLISIPLFIFISIIIGVAVNQNSPKKTAAHSYTNATTTETKAGEYPTEYECVEAIKNAYNKEFSGATARIELSFDSFKDKSSVYKLSLGGIELGEVLLSSPVSPDYEGYGYVTEILCSVDTSAMQYTADNLTMITHIATIPVYAYHILKTNYYGTLASFLKSFQTEKDSTTGWLYKSTVSSDALLFVNKTKLAVFSSYGETLGGMIRAMP